MNIWVIADTHYFHQNMVTLHGRPQDYEMQMTLEIAKVVEKSDLLIHCGDFAWKKPNDAFALFRMIGGTKVLVRGNHDYRSPQTYMEKGFDFACDSFTMFYKKKKLLFTHIPVHELPEGVDFNIHGHLHTHNNSHRKEEHTLQPFHRLIAIDDWNLKPIRLDVLLQNDL